MKKILLMLLVPAGFFYAQTQQPDTSKNIMTAQEALQSAVKDSAVQAAPKTKSNNYAVLDSIQAFTAQDYYDTIDSLKKNGTGDYLKLRAAFTKTPAYNPIDMDPGDSFREAYALLNQSNFTGSAAILDSILSVNYAHIKAHKLMGYIYTQLGDPKKAQYHYDIYKGLVNSIFNNGDGRSPQTAFIIIDEREESDVYDALNLFLESRNYGEMDGHKFHLTKGFDELKDNTYSFFFNIDIPRNHIKQN